MSIFSSRSTAQSSKLRPHEAIMLSTAPISEQILSAKSSSLKKLKRPQTAKLRLFSAQSTSQIDLNNISLSKLRPNVIDIEKEQLYDSNLALKVKYNSVYDENTRLKTKLASVEKELSSRDILIRGNPSPEAKKICFISNLKDSICKLKEELKLKNKELSEIKHSIKYTKIAELEAEVQTYSQECIRLRQAINEKYQIELPAAEIRPIDPSCEGLKKENECMMEIIEKLRNYNNTLKDKIKTMKGIDKRTKLQEFDGIREEVISLKLQLENLQRDYNSKENEHKNQMEDKDKGIEELLEKIKAEEKKYKELVDINGELKKKMQKIVQEAHIIAKANLKNPPKLFLAVNEIIVKSKLRVPQFLAKIDKHLTGFLNFEEFMAALRTFHCYISLEMIEGVSAMIVTKSNQISLELFEQWFAKYTYPHVNKSKEEEFLKYAHLRMSKLLSIEILPSNSKSDSDSEESENIIRESPNPTPSMKGSSERREIKNTYDRDMDYRYNEAKRPSSRALDSEAKRYGEKRDITEVIQDEEFNSLEIFNPGETNDKTRTKLDEQLKIPSYSQLKDEGSSRWSASSDVRKIR
ncbi:unnamed protein product [Blepharisma stoltei]|uniref:EF-hand domain-containing protein n=1 Tax=Blepharisma stoltei TaxID=1481888 RepID=A0AAU9JAF7_9CILI|nr:unnamed protein product [Blepharisma stoltei]